MTTQRLHIVENGMASGQMPERLSMAALDARAFKLTSAKLAAADRTPGRKHNRPRKNGPFSQGIAQDGCVTRPLRHRAASPEASATQGADLGWKASFPVRRSGRGIHLSMQPAPDLRH